ncbi:outer membrane protein assembly factor BamE [Colwellia psychrerythraea]|uniref:Outer membrane protein assembly factor BamE n=1 Tax=Colwellia psychrerythraea TaxID=28229 RepID=A0A099L3E2_COLPS|nr:outer membrane protein assembly factor BamE [Colwellia psychrerythraea]KGJ96398.1 SmpA/OmlA domain-containing protein [Colwellia psychrerythraea]
MYFRVAILVTALTLSACSSWVYRYDVPQGNYLEQKSIDKLQVGMTKEQVKFILGSAVVVDAFNDDTWSYVYKLKSGRNKDFDVKKQFIINFSNDKLISASGDYELSDKFNTPFNAPAVQATPANNNKFSTEATPAVENKSAESSDKVKG